MGADADVFMKGYDMILCVRVWVHLMRYDLLDITCQQSGGHMRDLDLDLDLNVSNKLQMGVYLIDNSIG
jgi:hypothetical protein